MKVWSNFAKRAPSLALRNKRLQRALLSPNLPEGPVSLKKRSSKIQYRSPEGLDEIYPLAYEFLEAESGKVYEKLENETDKAAREELQVEAEKNNPEVIYNALYGTDSLDRTQPIYRHFLEQNWKEYGRMLTMQRLESLAVIPDTLPTLEPEVDVRLQFPCNGVGGWVDPGTILPSNATAMPPTLEVVEFKESTGDLYTVLVVDPDTPEVEKDGFSTTLHWGLKNVRLTNEDSVIDARKLVAHPEYVFSQYVAPTPEKNTGRHRFAVWVFRQKAELGEVESGRKDFDIRQFAEVNELTAVGAHVWRSVWDRNVESVREKYGLEKGRVFTRGAPLMRAQRALTAK